MADLNSLESSQSIKIAGANTSGVETNFVNSTPTGDLSVNDGLRSGGTQGNLNLLLANTAYEVKVGASALANRKTITITAFDSDMYWGYNSSLTTSFGTPLFKGQQIIFNIDASDSSFKVYLICASTNKNARITESP